MPTSQGLALGAKPGTESVSSRHGHSFSSWKGHGDDLAHHPAIQGQDRKTETQASRSTPGRTVAWQHRLSDTLPFQALLTHSLVFFYPATPCVCVYVHAHMDRTEMRK